MNYYSLLPLIAFFANVILGCYILYKDPKNRLNILFSLFVFSLAIWSLTDFLTFTASTSEIGLYWGRLGTIGSAISPVVLLHYFLVFSKNKHISKKRVYIPLYLPAFFFIIVSCTTTLISESGRPTYWGYTTTSGLLYAPLAFYIVGYITIGLFSCYKFYKKTTSRKEKTQAKLLIIAISVPLIGGIITQVIPDIFVINILPLSTTLTTITAIIISYTIFRYSLMIPVRFSIRRKLAAVFLLLVIITGLATIGITSFFSREMIEQQIHSHLDTSAQSKAYHVETFLNNEKNRVLQLAESVVIERLLISNKTDEDYKDIFDDVIARLKNSTNIVKEIYEIIVIDINGVIASSNIEEKIGLNISEDLCFTNGAKGVYIRDAYLCRFDDQPSLAISAPILENVDNAVVGVIVIRIKLDSLNKIMTDRTGLGDTGETYIVNKDGYMITPSRTINDTFLTQEINSINFRNCMSAHEHPDAHGIEHIGHEPIAAFNNYRDTKVLGAHAYILEMQWALLAEIYESEALAPIYNIQNTIILAFIIIIIIAVIISFIISKAITIPIINLKNTAKIIGGGKLDDEIEIKSNDEMGDLANAFIDMAKNLKKQQENLERVVAERTKELQKKIEELEKYKKVTVGRELKMVEMKKQMEELKQKGGGLN